MPNNGNSLTTVRDFDHAIKVLGGTGPAAKRLGRTSSQVCQWRSRWGHFPPELFPRVNGELQREGYVAPYRLFGMEPPRRTG